MALAKFEHVQSRYHREIEEELRQLVETRLSDAEIKIRARIRDLDAKLLEDSILEDIVIRVCADAVIRLIKNPEGYVQETDGNYTYMLSQALSEGNLSIRPDEWFDLGVRKSIGVVNVIPQLPSSLQEGL